MTALHPLPASVVERCAATDGPYGGAHGAAASGANEPAAESLRESLAFLSAEMRASYAQWLAKQEEAR